MSPKINPREVLSYLNQLGYRNIDAIQLQEFIRDLKKLMKYQNKMINADQVVKVNVVHECTKNYGAFSSETDSGVKNNELVTSLSESLSALLMMESKCQSEELSSCLPKQTTDQNCLIGGTIKNTSKPPIQLFGSSSTFTDVCPAHNLKSNNLVKSVGVLCTCSIDALNKDSKSRSKDAANKNNRPTSSSTSKSDTTSSLTQNIRITKISNTKSKKDGPRKHNCYSHSFSQPCYCYQYMKPKSAVIKCTTGAQLTYAKCDPVNLYRYYQKQWKKNKIPGENLSRDQRFRWCFRERISCGPPAKK